MTKVLVVGCGLMGSALARALAGAGHEVTAWNRSPEKALALTGDGIKAADCLRAAVSDAALVIVCVGTYDDAEAALSQTENWSGKTIVNVGSSSAQGAERFARWAQEHGALYLDGAIFAYPKDIGAEGTIVAYCGPADVWEDNANTLLALGGGSRHVSDQIGGASVMDTAVIGSYFVAALAAFVEGAAYAERVGIPATSLLAVAEPVTEMLAETIRDAAQAISSDEFARDQSDVATFLQASIAFRSAMRAAGQQAAQLSAAIELLQAACDAGHGESSFFVASKFAGAGAGSSKPETARLDPRKPTTSSSTASSTVHRFWALDSPSFPTPLSTLVVGGEGIVDCPFPSYLIEHTPGELVLVDTGLRPQAAEDPVGAYGALGARLYPDGYPRHLAVDRQLEALGYEPGDIRTVIITHLHIDHTGAMPLFEHARFIGGQGEMQFALWPDPVQADGFYIKDDFAFLAERRSQWTEVGPQDHDVFGDGSIVLYHLPGHTPGQLAVLVRTRQQNILLAADVVHVREGLGGKPFPGDWSAAHTARSVERLKLIAAANNAQIWVGHDAQDWANMKHAPGVYD